MNQFGTKSMQKEIKWYDQVTVLQSYALVMKCGGFGDAESDNN